MTFDLFDFFYNFIFLIFTANCVDVDKHCALYSSQGFCNEPFTASAMRTLCKRSCDLCSV